MMRRRLAHLSSLSWVQLVCIACVLPCAGADYIVVDTGQSACYDNSTVMICPAPGAAFYGQDAQYDGNQPVYTISGDGLTVYDSSTGLT
ncbi:MAG: hypothetical protein JSU63_15780 [Phycisphaerales bacterium]|nr:MAG: hypothetical protein JSU63_15780 [Phycisphaerales bacterium]